MPELPPAAPSDDVPGRRQPPPSPPPSLASASSCLALCNHSRAQGFHPQPPPVTSLASIELPCLHRLPPPPPPLASAPCNPLPRSMCNPLPHPLVFCLPPALFCSALIGLVSSALHFESLNHSGSGQFITVRLQLSGLDGLVNLELPLDFQVIVDYLVLFAALGVLALDKDISNAHVMGLVFPMNKEMDPSGVC